MYSSILNANRIENIKREQVITKRLKERNFKKLKLRRILSYAGLQD
jgi:hypothetical protein